MKIYYDEKVDALYIELLSLLPGTAENRDLTEDIVGNYSPDEKLTGIEILDASLVLGDALQEIIFENSTIGVTHKFPLLSTGY